MSRRRRLPSRPCPNSMIASLIVFLHASTNSFVPKIEASHNHLHEFANKEAVGLMLETGCRIDTNRVLCARGKYVMGCVCFSAYFIYLGSIRRNYLALPHSFFSWLSPCSTRNALKRYFPSVSFQLQSSARQTSVYPLLTSEAGFLSSLSTSITRSFKTVHQVTH